MSTILSCMGPESCLLHPDMALLMPTSLYLLLLTWIMVIWSSWSCPTPPAVIILCISCIATTIATTITFIIIMIILHHHAYYSLY